MNRNISNDILSKVFARAVARTKKKTFGETEDIKNEESQNIFGILASILDQSEEIIIVINDVADIVFVNSKACELLGYSKAELLSLSIIDIAPNIDSEILLQDFFVGSRDEGLLTIELIYKTKSKKPFLVKVEISQMMSGGCYYSLVGKNSSSSKWISDSLSFDEKFFMDMVESSPNIVARYDLSYRCIYVNEACERILGYPRSKLIGKFVGQSGFMSNAQIKELKHNLRLITESGLPIEFDLELVHADTGMPVYLNVIVIVMHNKKNKISGIMAIANDFSELKSKEKELFVAKDRAEESSHIKSFFLETICRDMKTSLNMIISLSGLLKNEGIKKKDTNTYANMIEGFCDKLYGITELIQSLIAIESDHFELNPEHYHAHTVIKEQYLEINDILRLKEKDQIGVNLDLADCKDETTLFGDVSLIKQVLHILTSNAVKSIKKGEITIGVQFLKDGWVTFYVSDKGIGIPEKKQKILFDPSDRPGISGKWICEQFGIDLYIAHIISQVLGGDIILVSEPGEGNVFIFSIPTVCGTLDSTLTGSPG
jgi:PAS domain S-box-containing protein